MATHGRSWGQEGWWLLGCQKTQGSTDGQQSRFSSAWADPIMPTQSQMQPSGVQANLLSPENKLLVPKLIISNGPWTVLDHGQCLVVAWEDCMGTMLRTEEIISCQGTSLDVVKLLYMCSHGVCCQSGTGLGLSLGTFTTCTGDASSFPGSALGHSSSPSSG